MGATRSHAVSRAQISRPPPVPWENAFHLSLATGWPAVARIARGNVPRDLDIRRLPLRPAPINWRWAPGGVVDVAADLSRPCSSISPRPIRPGSGVLPTRGRTGWRPASDSQQSGVAREPSLTAPGGRRRSGLLLLLICFARPVAGTWGKRSTGEIDHQPGCFAWDRRVAVAWALRGGGRVEWLRAVVVGQRQDYVKSRCARSVPVVGTDSRLPLARVTVLFATGTGKHGGIRTNSGRFR
jgi:hypothetical protein